MYSVIKQYLLYSRKHWFSGILTFIVYGVAVVLMQAIQPLYYKKIIDTMSTVKPEEASGELFSIFLVICAINVLSQICFRTGDYVIAWFQSNVLRIISNDLFDRIHRHSTGFFEDNFVGSLVTKSRRFTRSFEAAQHTLTWNVWFTIVTCVSILTSLLFISKLLAGILAIWILIYVWVTLLFLKFKRPYDLAKASQDSKVTGLLADTLTNFLNIKMFSSMKAENESFREQTKIEARKRYATWQLGNHQNTVQAILLAIILELVMLYISITLWTDGKITIGTIVLVQAYVVAIFTQIWGLAKGLTRLTEALNDGQEMMSILDESIDVEDPMNPEILKISEGTVQFHDIGFAYGSGEKLFDTFDLTIPAGQRIGLIGHSGAGKTTILKLLLRFIDSTNGKITIDDQDITTITQDDLRSSIAYVPQEPLLFHRTLRENILYGDPGASEEQMIEAAKQAHAHEFITSLPYGYDTLVGERGIKLSGGERQRVAIARAMLKDAPILILDEATSALDSISERHIQSAFENLMKGRTTIVIAHRLSTVQKMDRIIVLEKCIITEEGTHQELVERDGVYNSFWKEQAGGFL